jgi:hypothetical protein
MRWGVRRTKSELAGPTPITINAKPGKKIVTTGGKNLPVSEDAKTAAVIKQKARASGAQSLSNDEMRILVTRMNLEQQYAKLNPKQVSIGEKFLKEYGPVGALEGAKIYYKTTGKDVPTNVKIGMDLGDQILKAKKKDKK